MPSTEKIQLDSLDFDDILGSLRSYLKGKPVFLDYNFEGSALSVIMELLAYVAHYDAVYNNMQANELFLDTAALRISVVSRSKNLGYTPQSKRSAVAYVDISMTGLSGSTTTLSRSTLFTSAVDGVTYTFFPQEATVLPVSGGAASVSRFKLREGTALTYTYTKDAADPDQRFIIPSIDADTGTLIVTVQEGLHSTSQTVYNLADDINEVTSTSHVYWLQETEDGYYEVLFGNDVLGLALSDGNLVILDYIITNGDAVNFASTFELNDTGGTAVVTISDQDSYPNIPEYAHGGADRESIRSIKFMAPRAYQSQNRAVPHTDYKTRVMAEFPGSVEAVNAWGGEMNSPPEFGKVFIAIKPTDGLYLTDNMKRDIIAGLKKYNVVTIQPQIVDPDYIFIVVDSEVTFDSSQTAYTSGDLQGLVDTTIQEFSATNLQVFENEFYYSQLVEAINDTDDSILNNDTTVKMKMRWQPDLVYLETKTLKFSNPIKREVHSSRGSLTSTAFTYNGKRAFFDDDPANAVLRIYSVGSEGERVYESDSAGTVGYSNGEVISYSFKPESYEGNFVEVSI